ncbi:virulence RhuM family protein, partial [Malonomonas rubra]|uniref:virulence RhuM family protein n=1 Tax=Malonomonas rubra TaxID=57040 RepID=UPI0026EA8147
MPDKIIIYQSADGKAALEVRLEQESLWLTQAQLSELFDVKIPAISKHVSNILNSGELDASATVSKMEKVQIEGGRKVKRKNVAYNLDMIISVGYRVNSAKATRFRVWATQVLRDHLVQGYTLNRQRLEEQTRNLTEMRQAIELLSRTLDQQRLVNDLGKDVLQVITDYAYALNLLDRYDHGTLSIEKTSGQSDFILDYDKARSIVESMKDDFDGLFGIEKDQGFKSALGTIYQTFDGKE